MMFLWRLTDCSSSVLATTASEQPRLDGKKGGLVFFFGFFRRRGEDGGGRRAQRQDGLLTREFRPKGLFLADSPFAPLERS